MKRRILSRIAIFTLVAIGALLAACAAHAAAPARQAGSARTSHVSCAGIFVVADTRGYLEAGA